MKIRLFNSADESVIISHIIVNIINIYPTIDHRVFEINNKVNKWRTFKCKHPMYKILNQLISGHHQLNSYGAKVTNGSPLCQCGEFESVEHLVFVCEKYSRIRFNFGKELSHILKENCLPLSKVKLQTIFGQTMSLTDKINNKVINATLKFLLLTKRFK